MYAPELDNNNLMLEPSSCTIRINNYDYLLNVSSAYQPGIVTYNSVIIEFTSDRLLPSVPLSSTVLDSSVEIASSNCYTQENKLIFKCDLQEYFYRIIKEQITIKVIESTFILNNTIPDYVYIVDDSTSTMPSNKTEFKPGETVWIYAPEHKTYSPMVEIGLIDTNSNRLYGFYPNTLGSCYGHYSAEMPSQNCSIALVRP